MKGEIVMNYRIEVFKRDHLAQLRVGPETEEAIAFLGIDRFSKCLQPTGPAYTGFVDDDAIIIGGVNILWQGVGEIWGILGVDAHKHSSFIGRNVAKYLDELQKELKLQRVQAVVLREDYAGIEWLSKLDFEFEGEMKGYFQGKSYLRYAKIFGGE
jgi:hypothetical protein